MLIILGKIDTFNCHLKSAQRTVGTDKTIFEWFVGQPELLGHFNNYMALYCKQNEGFSWLSVWPVAAVAAGKPAEQPLCVDMGGAIGHQYRQFKENFPTFQPV